MKNFFLLIAGLILLLGNSCNEDPSKMHKRYMIDRDKFVNILVDMHVMDAITSGSRYYGEFHPDDTLDLYSNIFEKYRVTQADFDSTVASYTRRPDLYLDVYDEVLLKLNVRLDELDKEEQEQEQKLEQEQEQEQEQELADEMR